MNLNKKTKIDINSSKASQKADIFFDISFYQNLRAKKNKQEGFSQLISSRGRNNKFITEDSRRYITPREYESIEKGLKLDRDIKKWDSLSSRILREYKTYRSPFSTLLVRSLERRLDIISEHGNKMVDGAIVGLREKFSLVRLWNISIVGAILLGMFSMTMIYRYLGQGAAAGSVVAYPNSQEQQIQKTDSDDKEVTEAERVFHQFDDIDNQDKFEKEARKLVKGYPIEEMLPYILAKDRKVAAYLIAIAKKESNWGKRVPTLEGQDCNNYWGYRGQRNLMGTGGHTCFNSKKDAVDTVGKRLDNLINKEKIDTPAEMVVWKCGSSCAATGGQAAANKWISDVDMYMKKLVD